jgi:SNF2 family DNA or RNA helicase
MAEAQAVDRVHRIGQTREVVVTRYIVSNTIETVCLVRRLSAQILVLMLQVATLLDRDRKLTRTSTSNGFSRIN